MLKICNVTKKYKKFYALSNVSFELGTGVYGLIGENGAGKTTIMKILTGQTRADQGQIFYRHLQWNDQCKAKIGYLPQNFEFFDHLTVLEALEYLNLTECTAKRIKRLSGGMRQRLGIAQAFLGNPEMILLDEPTVGLDPKERLAFRNMINEVCDDRTILISTHILDDVESTCEKLISLRQGEIIYEGKISSYINKERKKVFTTKLNREDISKIGKEISMIAVKREEEKINIRFVIHEKELFQSLDVYKNAEIRKAETSLEDAYFLNTYLI